MLTTIVDKYKTVSVPRAVSPFTVSNKLQASIVCHNNELKGFMFMLPGIEETFLYLGGESEVETILSPLVEQYKSIVNSLKLEPTSIVRVRHSFDSVILHPSVPSFGKLTDNYSLGSNCIVPNHIIKSETIAFCGVAPTVLTHAEMDKVSSAEVDEGLGVLYLFKSGVEDPHHLVRNAIDLNQIALYKFDTSNINELEDIYTKKLQVFNTTDAPIRVTFDAKSLINQYFASNRVLPESD